MAFTEADCLNSSISSFSVPAASLLSCTSCWPGPRCLSAELTLGWSEEAGFSCARSGATLALTISSASTAARRIFFADAKHAVVEVGVIADIIAPLPPAAERGARFPAPTLSRRLANPSLPRRDRFRYLFSPPPPAPAPCCGLRSRHWCEPAARPAGALPGHEILPLAPRATSARTLQCAPRLRQCRRAIFRSRLPSCCAARPEQPAMACARSRCKARTAAPAESPSVPIRAVIPLVVEAFHPCVADIDRNNEGYENC